MKNFVNVLVLKFLRAWNTFWSEVTDLDALEFLEAQLMALPAEERILRMKELKDVRSRKAELDELDQWIAKWHVNPIEWNKNK